VRSPVVTCCLAVADLAACEIRIQNLELPTDNGVHGMRRQMKEEEVNRIVRAIDATRADLFSMSNVDDAPIGKAFRKRVKEDVQITRAKSRLRMAAWRKKNAEERRPTGEQIMKSMLAALLTSTQADLQRSDRTLIGKALKDLAGRGFDLHATKAYLRRMRGQMVPPADRAGESSADHIF
jgi:hypothetical protein